VIVAKPTSSTSFTIFLVTPLVPTTHRYLAAAMRPPSLISISGACIFLLSLLLLHVEAASSSDGTQWIQSTNADGETVYLDNNRRPALYTQDFGDCQGDSVVELTRFNAAYYKDNMTILFHLEGSTAVANESVMSQHNISSWQKTRTDDWQCI